MISLTADAIASYMHITLLFLNEKSNLLHVKWLVQNGFYWSTKQFRAEVHIVGDILRIDVTVILLFKARPMTMQKSKSFAHFPDFWQ